MKFQGTVEGFDALATGLKKWPKSVQEGLERAIFLSMNEGLRTAKALVPVDTGELKESIKGEFKRERGGDSIEAVITATAPYARVVEFGRTQGNRGTTAPQPFIQPAQALVQKKHSARIRRVLNKTAKEVVANRG